MQKNFQLSPEQLDQLLQTAGKKLGQSPSTVRTQLEKGQLEPLLSQLGPTQHQQMIRLMQDPQALQQFLQTTQVQQLLKHLTENTSSTKDSF